MCTSIRHIIRIKTLNFSALSAPWAPQNRGMAGMDEAVAFRLFNMVGVPAYYTSWFQLRVIDALEQAGPSNQYEGDLWGLYLAFENPNNQFLDEHDLPDGNLYKMQGSHYYLNQGPTQPTDKSDLMSFISGSSGYNKANPVIHEPIMRVVVETPTEFQGVVMGSLNKRRGMIVSAQDEGQLCVIEARVPLADMFGYSTGLRSLTQGKAQFTMEFVAYKQVPQSIAEELVKKAAEKKKSVA